MEDNAIKSAIAYIRQWREREALPALGASEEKRAAQLYIKQKGLHLPSVYAGMPLENGVYTNLSMPTKTSLRDQNLFPWDPQDKRDFWCSKIGKYVNLTGDVQVNGTYYVTEKAGSISNYPVKGHEIVLAEQATALPEEGDLLAINLVTWGTIKNFLVERFINSYPWSGADDKTPDKVRDEKIALAKSSRNGLARLIEKERGSERGVFENAASFRNRMNAVSPGFPWEDFALSLDFTLPRV